jgi:hypothetical protein
MGDFDNGSHVIGCDRPPIKHGMVGGYLVDMTVHFANGGLISRFTRANGP